MVSSLLIEKLYISVNENGIFHDFSVPYEPQIKRPYKTFSWFFTSKR